jgi:aspartyl-tRNA synthetase
MVEGIIKEADVKSCTIQSYEIGIRKLYTAVEVGDLPFSIDDASRPEADFARVS